MINASAREKWRSRPRERNHEGWQERNDGFRDILKTVATGESNYRNGSLDRCSTAETWFSFLKKFHEPRQLADFPPDSLQLSQISSHFLLFFLFPFTLIFFARFAIFPFSLIYRLISAQILMRTIASVEINFFVAF